MADTIVAISTANGAGAISIVRMSGDDALNIASKLTKTTFTPRYAKLTKFYMHNLMPHIGGLISKIKMHIHIYQILLKHLLQHKS